MAYVKNKLNWQAFSTEDRNKVIEVIKDTITKNGGYIINFNLFSDLALSLSIEIEENKISNLYKELHKIINISEPAPGNLNDHSKMEWWILMNVSFGKGKGNLKVEIPNVPG